jgi:ParB/RepB/Spo0J family partition protein
MNPFNIMKLPEGKTRLDLVREGLADSGAKKRGRLIVSMEKLREDPRNERRTFRNMDGLIASIRAVGLIEPITVSPADGDTYQIITGHRRYRAAKAAGLTQVEVLIRDPEDELMRRQKSIVSNVQREDVGPVEMAEALQALMDEDPRIQSQGDLARLIGKDKTWVSGMVRILSLSSELQQKVGSTQLSVSYDSMMRIARLDKESDQSELVEALLSGSSQRDIRDQIDQIKGKPARTIDGLPRSAMPKRVFHTRHKASVIVQATGNRLTPDQCVLALKEAVQQAVEAAIAEPD